MGSIFSFVIPGNTEALEDAPYRCITDFLQDDLVDDCGIPTVDKRKTDWLRCGTDDKGLYVGGAAHCCHALAVLLQKFLWKEAIGDLACFGPRCECLIAMTGDEQSTHRTLTGSNTK